MEKVKLQDYSLISNEWIDEEIKTIKEHRNRLVFGSINYILCDGKISALETIKSKTIPTNKLQFFVNVELLLEERKDILEDYGIEGDDTSKKYQSEQTKND